MSSALNFDFEVNTSKGNVYWWPIICEIVGEYGFQFAHPELPGRQSQYLVDTDMVRGTFKDLWESISRGMESVLATFWHQGSEFDHMELIIQTWQKSDEVFSLGLMIPGPYVTTLSAMMAKKLLKFLLACATRIYEVCSPTYGQSYWSFSVPDSTPWATFGSPPTQPFALTGYTTKIPEQQLITQPLAGGKSLYFFDPVPYIPALEAGYVSLLEEEA